MSTQRDELAWEIFSIDNAAIADEALRLDFPQEAGYAQHIAEGLIAAGWTKPCTITTVEELDDLPVGSVVLDVEGDVCERAGSGWTGIIKERSMDSWLLTGAEAIDLPATVLYEPTV